MLELGVFLTLEECSSNGGGVSVKVSLHDGEMVCIDKLASSIWASMFSYLLVGAVQLHDPGAIIIIDRDPSQNIPAIIRRSYVF